MIAALREQLEQANERARENRRIIAALTSRIPQLEAPAETPEAYEAADEQQGRGAPTPMPQALRRPYRGLGGVGCSEGSVDEKSLQLLKVMREQLGETTGRTVDAGAAARPRHLLPVGSPDVSQRPTKLPRTP